MEYWRVMLKLGNKNNKAEECVRAGYVGVDTAIQQDISDSLSGERGDFIRRFLSAYRKERPNKTQKGAEQTLGALWRFAKDMEPGDIVLSPDGRDKYYVGEISGDYCYDDERDFFHCRPVKWLDKQILRAKMPESLRKVAGCPGTIVNLSNYAGSIKRLLGEASEPVIADAPADDASGESPGVFAQEEHLEDFLVKNWRTTWLGDKYDIYRENGKIARQYPTDTGFIDILAISKDRKTWLVVELKKDNASDRAVGQVLRYMGYIQEKAEEGQKVRGIVVAANDDRRSNLRIKRALEVLDSVDFYRYKVALDIQPD